jgi:hypothetical protein
MPSPKPLKYYLLWYHMSYQYTIQTPTLVICRVYYIVTARKPSTELVSQLKWSITIHCHCFQIGCAIISMQSYQMSVNKFCTMWRQSRIVGSHGSLTTCHCYNFHNRDGTALRSPMGGLENGDSLNREATTICIILVAIVITQVLVTNILFVMIKMRSYFHQPRRFNYSDIPHVMSLSNKIWVVYYPLWLSSVDDTDVSCVHVLRQLDTLLTGKHWKKHYLNSTEEGWMKTSSPSLTLW